MITWGIIGTGKIAQKFADDLRLAPGAVLGAVASRTRERAQTFADRYGAARAFDRFEDLAACEEVDVVYIASPHTAHFEHTMCCLRHGKAVLCEKPFAMNAQQAAAAFQLAREKKVFLMEALWTLFIPGVRAALEYAQNGGIGRVHTVKSDFGFFSPYDADFRLFNPRLGGGALLDIGIYPVLWALAVLGAPPETGIHCAGTLTRDGVDETCAFTFHYPDQRLAMGHASIAANTPIEAFIYGDQGQIRLHPRWHHTQEITIERLHAAPETLRFPFEGWGYHFEAVHVMECLAAGSLHSPVVGPDLTLSLSACMDRMLEQMGVRYEEST